MVDLPYLRGTGREYIEFFEDYWQPPWYELPVDNLREKVVLLTICSHAKPYGKSYIHMEIKKHLAQIPAPNGEADYSSLRDKVVYAHLSSAGVVPEWADDRYPFCAYDWNVAEARPEDIAQHIANTTRRLSTWYSAYGWRAKGVVTYLRPAPAHTTTAVDYSSIPVKAVEVDPTPYDIPGARYGDIDDCLTRPENLIKLSDTVAQELS